MRYQQLPERRPVVVRQSPARRSLPARPVDHVRPTTVASRQDREQNPDLFGDVLLLGLVVGAVAVGYEVIKNLNSAAGLSGNAYQAGSDLRSVVGSGVQGAVTGAVDSFLLPGGNICTVIQTWRQQGAPAFALLAGFPIIPNIQWGGGDPQSWDTFSSFVRNTQFVDPGPTPPPCW